MWLYGDAALAVHAVLSERLCVRLYGAGRMCVAVCALLPWLYLPMQGHIVPPTPHHSRCRPLTSPSLHLPAQCVDAAIILQNDQLAEICRRRLGVSRASFRDMNSVIADQLACQLLPLERRIGQASLWEAGAVAEPEARCPLGEAITDAVPLPVRCHAALTYRIVTPHTFHCIMV